MPVLNIFGKALFPSEMGRFPNGYDMRFRVCCAKAHVVKIIKKLKMVKNRRAFSPHASDEMLQQFDRYHLVYMSRFVRYVQNLSTQKY